MGQKNSSEATRQALDTPWKCQVLSEGEGVILKRTADSKDSKNAPVIMYADLFTGIDPNEYLDVKQNPLVVMVAERGIRTSIVPFPTLSRVPEYIKTNPNVTLMGCRLFELNKDDLVVQAVHRLHQYARDWEKSNASNIRAEIYYASTHTSIPRQICDPEGLQPATASTPVMCASKKHIFLRYAHDPNTETKFCGHCGCLILDDRLFKCKIAQWETFFESHFGISICLRCYQHAK